jgi:hypothetical protein
VEFGDAKEPRAPGLSYGEHLRTPLGSCYRRTHRVRECVERSRAAVEGRPYVPGPTREERKREVLGS